VGLESAKMSVVCTLEFLEVLQVLLDVVSVGGGVCSGVEGYY
jgi:hypothetical protein